jgi:hypothetical protein
MFKTLLTQAFSLSLSLYLPLSDFYFFHFLAFSRVSVIDKEKNICVDLSSFFSPANPQYFKTQTPLNERDNPTNPSLHYITHYTVTLTKKTVIRR